MGTSVNPHRFLRLIEGAVLLPVTACAIARTQAAEGKVGAAARTMADTSARIAGRTGIAEMSALPGATPPFLAATARLESGEERRLTGATRNPASGAGTGSRALGVAILVAIVAVVMLWGAAAIMAKTEKT